MCCEYVLVNSVMLIAGKDISSGIDIGKFSYYLYENCNIPVLMYANLHCTVHELPLVQDDENDVDATPVWVVDNSWGTTAGDGGSYVMQEGWFRRHVFEVVVDRAFLQSGVVAQREV